VTDRFLAIAMSAAVKTVQQEMGCADLWQGRVPAAQADTLSAREIRFIQTRNSFYLATVSETGWPYIQHRGGAAGFLQVVDQSTLAFADFRGNRQYISSGNITTNDRVCLFLMDYRQRRRLKILARARRYRPADERFRAQQLVVPAYDAVIEQIFILQLEAFDWNCPQHIFPPPV